MASLKAARKALASTIQTRTGIRCYYNIPDNPVLPCAVVVPDNSQLLTFGRGDDSYLFSVEVIASGGSDAEQDWLDDALTGAGPSSIREAIYVDPTLGTAVYTSDAGALYGASATGIQDYRKMTVGAEGSLHWSGRLHVEVVTSGKV